MSSGPFYRQEGSSPDRTSLSIANYRRHVPAVPIRFTQTPTTYRDAVAILPAAATGHFRTKADWARYLVRIGAVIQKPTSSAPERTPDDLRLLIPQSIELRPLQLRPFASSSPLKISSESTVSCDGSFRGRNFFQLFGLLRTFTNFVLARKTGIDPRQPQQLHHSSAALWTNRSLSGTVISV